ncbi:hypothetical protein, partial [Bacillus sp. 123MFChir2]|uniref:hypothetical protein n=1 Tax=Bacillus sp. 123MFChir2 TaxID=1169144 RepID=UPI001E3B5BF7
DEVCPNTGISHRSLPKHEKNSPSSDQKGSVEGLFFLFFIVSYNFFIHSYNKGHQRLGNPKGFPTL